MQIFKIFYKILFKNIFSIIIYIGVFAILCFIMSSSTTNISYKKTKINAVMEIEEETPTSKVFTDYLNEYINQKDIGKLSIDDALFTSEISIYLHIPKDFAERLFNNEEKIITIQKLPGDFTSYALEQAIENFFNQVKTNLKIGLAAKDEVFTYVKSNISLIEESYTINLYANDTVTKASSSFLFGFYVISAFLLSIVSLLMDSFRSLGIRKRMNIGSISSTKINLIFLLCNMLLGVIYGIIIFLLTAAFVGFDSIGSKAIYYIINNILYSLVFVSLAYMLSTMIKSKHIKMTLTVVVPLGGAFLSGLFVPKEIMNSTVLAVAHALPQYYANICSDFIATTPNIKNMDFILKLLPYIPFLIVFIMITLIINRRNIKAEE